MSLELDPVLHRSKSKGTKNKEQITLIREQGAKSVGRRTHDGDQSTKRKEQRAQNNEQRTGNNENKEQRAERH